ncbi:hypothetical protein A2U01_0100078, partial [Trifolium medium]|nr:hypothetical protein [Trifolium medium]
MGVSFKEVLGDGGGNGGLVKTCNACSMKQNLPSTSTKG